jgi:hypothetical protein
MFNELARQTNALKEPEATKDAVPAKVDSARAPARPAYTNNAVAQDLLNQLSRLNWFGNSDTVNRALSSAESPLVEDGPDLDVLALEAEDRAMKAAARAMDAEQKKWITANGAHIPVDEDGELEGKVGERIKASEAAGEESSKKSESGGEKGKIPKSLSEVSEIRQGKNKLPLTAGTDITRKTSFAGKGSRKILHDENRLLKQFGGKKGEWSHETGEGFVDFRGESRKAEIHWFNEPSVGIIGVKFKKWINQ